MAIYHACAICCCSYLPCVRHLLQLVCTMQMPAAAPIYCICAIYHTYAACCCSYLPYTCHLLLLVSTMRAISAAARIYHTYAASCSSYLTYTCYLLHHASIALFWVFNSWTILNIQFIYCMTINVNNQFLNLFVNHSSIRHDELELFSLPNYRIGL